MIKKNGLYRIVKLFCLLFLFQSVMVCNCVRAKENAAPRSVSVLLLAAPVLLTGDDGTVASGFYMNTEMSTFLVTAGHVLFETQPGGTKRRLKMSRINLVSYSPAAESDYSELEFDLNAFYKKGHIKHHDSHDVTVIKIGIITSKKPLSVKPVTGIVMKRKSGFSLPHITMVKRFEEVLTGNDVFVFGYPASIGLKNIPQIDFRRPLLRKGIVAGKNKKLQTIILDCPVNHGNSGGMVVEVSKSGPSSSSFRLIGVISQYVPYEEIWVNVKEGYANTKISNSGYSVVVPMDKVLELVTE